MIIFVFAAMLIALLAVIFALQNTAAVTVGFLLWTFQGSLALVLLIALFAGVLMSFLLCLPSLVRHRWTIRQLRRRLAALEPAAADQPKPSAPKPGKKSAPETGKSSTPARPAALSAPAQPPVETETPAKPPDVVPPAKQ